MDWLVAWGPSILAVVVAAAFTWLFGYSNERQHRQGVRALVAQELWQNESAVRVFTGSLKLTVDESKGNALFLVRALHLHNYLIPWQRARWLLPDVGVAFKPRELTELTEWYVGLDQLTFLYDDYMHYVDQVTQTLSPGGNISNDVAKALFELHEGVITFAEKIAAKTPPIPDPRLERDREMQQYAEKLKQNATDANPPQPEAPHK